MQWKGLLVIAVIALVSVAIATRISALGKLVFGGGSAPASS